MSRARRHLRIPAAHDRGFSLIEAMIASAIMLIGLLGLAGLQITGLRANHLGKRMAQASLLAQDLAQNMEIWSYTDARLTPLNNTGLFGTTNAPAIARGWDLANSSALVSNADGTAITFDYTDGPAGATQVNQLGANYSGVPSPTDSSLPPGEQVIFQRYWNVFDIDLTGAGTAQGKLVQIVVRWKEPRFGYRQVNTSFYKYDASLFNN